MTAAVSDEVVPRRVPIARALAFALLAAISAAAAAPGLPMVAVLPFTGRSLDAEALDGVASALGSDLLNSGRFRVMERGRMDAILREQGFQQSGACDGSECAVEVGKILAVDHIVVGSVSKVGELFVATTRLVDVRTGEVVRSATRSGPARAESVVTLLLPQLAQDLTADRPSRDESPPAPDEPRPAAVPARSPAISARGGMKPVPKGCFEMGAASCGLFSGEGQTDECPRHRVCLDSFRMDSTEVTQEAYRKAVGSNPSQFGGCGGNCPVEQVSWSEADRYCRGQGKRLPTEAQWEYAARAGADSRWPWGNRPDSAARYAWFGANSGNRTHPVARKAPNAWGLYDMAGNVAEWTADWKGDYGAGQQSNPTGPRAGQDKATRGGSWSDPPEHLRSSYRDSFEPSDRFRGLGFRCAAP